MTFEIYATPTDKAQKSARYKHVRTAIRKRYIRVNMMYIYQMRHFPEKIHNRILSRYRLLCE